MSKVKYYRNKIGISQENLARKVGCTLRTIQNIESGSIPKVTLALKIQEVLKVNDLKDLFDLT